MKKILALLCLLIVTAIVPAKVPESTERFYGQEEWSEQFQIKIWTQDIRPSTLTTTKYFTVYYWIPKSWTLVMIKDIELDINWAAAPPEAKEVFPGSNLFSINIELQEEVYLDGSYYLGQIVMATADKWAESSPFTAYEWLIELNPQLR